MVYLIYGTSYHLIDDEIKKIFNNLDGVEIIDYNKTSIEEMLISFNYVSLFDEEKKIIVKNCNLFSSKKDKESDLLLKYLEEPNKSATIIFTTYEKPDERKKITKIIKDNKKYISINNLSPKDIIDRIINICKDKKYKISYDNAKYIANCLLNNYDLIIMELDKIFLYYLKPCEILKEDIENIISKMNEDNNFKFTDAVLNKDIKLAIKILNDLKIQKVEPLILTTLLAKEYRNILYCKKLQNTLNNYDIAKKLSLQDWQVDKYLAKGYNYSIKQLEDKLLDLTELDYQIKTSSIEKYLALELFILKD